MSLNLNLALDRPPRRGEEAFALDVDLRLPDRGITTLFGPSGCGKTTLLRCVAGLENNVRGRITLGGTVWRDDAAGIDLPTYRRRLAYVFQEGGLFPHLNVRGNLEYARRRAAAGANGPSLVEAAEMMGITTLLARNPADLSGGERQRAALARALLSGCRLLLLDEPLAALDRAGRRAIYPYLETLRDEIGLPILHVTHAVEEAARLADHIVLMTAGKVRATGPLAEVLTSSHPGLACDPDAAAVLETEVAGHDPEFHLARLEFSGGRLLTPDPELRPGSRVRVRVPARDVSLALEPPDATTILNILPVRILEILDGGPAKVVVRLDAAGSFLLAAVTRRSAERLALAPGREVYAQVKSIALL